MPQLAAHDEVTTDNHMVEGISDMFDVCPELWGPSAMIALLKPTESSVYSDKLQRQVLRMERNKWHAE